MSITAVDIFFLWSQLPTEFSSKPYWYLHHDSLSVRQMLWRGLESVQCVTMYTAENSFLMLFNELKYT